MQNVKKSLGQLQFVRSFHDGVCVMITHGILSGYTIFSELIRQMADFKKNNSAKKRGE